jgi:hypothetical protein
MKYADVVGNVAQALIEPFSAEILGPGRVTGHPEITT